MLRTLLGAAPAVLALLAQGQEPAQPAERQTPDVKTPITVSNSRASAGPAQADELDGEGVLLEGREVPFDGFDDSVPLPEKPVYHATPAGDVLVEPASGDPFFLGFAAGRHYPPAAERLDPELSRQVKLEYADGRPSQHTYAFVMFSKRITQARRAQLESLGARVLEFHPHYCLKVALPVSALDQVAFLDFVRWVGVPRAWQKVHPGLAVAFAAARSGTAIDAYVNVFDSDLNPASTSRAVGTTEEGGPSGVRLLPEDDPQLEREWMSNGWQQRELERLGLEVRAFEESIRAFRVWLRPESMPALLELDFVQFVEAKATPQLAHDESMPMVNLDRTRVSYDGGTNDVAVAAQADSGIDYAHSGITGFYWWANNLTGTSEATTTDLCGHGSHVAGTIHGNTSVEPSWEGAANFLAQLPTLRYFNTKIFYGAGCDYGGASIASILGVMDGAVTDGNGNVTQRPHVINHSWGSFGTGPYFGTEADCRTIDNSVFANNQLHVWAAGNTGPSGSSIWMEGSSKNVLTVGNVADYEIAPLAFPGTIWTDSSRGPTGDLRWKPNLCAPGTKIWSVDAGTGTGYTNETGTSMATPHVTGLAAQMVDHYPFLRYNPTTTTALLMAAAITKNNVVLTTPSTTSTDHLNTYGAGRIEAWKSHFTGSDLAWGYWGWTWNGGGWLEVDMPVNAGATRIVVCMNYHEAAASSGASQALVNDLDMYIDAPPLTPGGNTGEYFAQQSPRDNSEIRIVDNPVTGTWRIKIWPESMTSSTHVGLAVQVQYGDTTPAPNTALTANDSFVKPNQNVTFDYTYNNPEGMASAVYLETGSTGDVLQAASTTLFDGTKTDLLDNQKLGREVLLGDVKFASTRSAEWITRWPTEGIKSFCVRAVSDNALSDVLCTSVVVDGTPPGVVTNLTSSTHQAGVWSNQPNVNLGWTTASDNLSGIDGYGIDTSLGAPALPGAVKDIGAVNTHVLSLSDTSNTYFNIRALDKSGNWSGSYAFFGPLLIDLQPPSSITGLHSTTHQVGVTSCNTQITMAWDPVTDSGSAVAGFSYIWDHQPISQPVPPINLVGNVTSASFTLSSDPQPWYFHITPVDVAGNNQNAFHAGPYSINTNSVSTYCTAKANSIPGCVSSFSTLGTPSVSGGQFLINYGPAPGGLTGLYIYTTQGAAAIPASTPFGFLCINTSGMVRTPAILGGGSSGTCTGNYTLDFINFFNTQTVNPNLVIGSTVDLQAWYRDPPNPGSANLSNAMKFLLCP